MIENAAETTNTDEPHPSGGRRGTHSMENSVPIKMSDDGEGENREFFCKMKIERLIVNTEVYPCMERAFVSLDALHRTRIKDMQSKGIEHKTHMEAYEKRKQRRKTRSDQRKI